MCVCVCVVIGGLVVITWLMIPPVVVRSESHQEQTCFQCCFQILLITPPHHIHPAPCNGDLVTHLPAVPTQLHVTRDLALAEGGQDPLPVFDAA